MSLQFNPIDCRREKLGKARGIEFERVCTISAKRFRTTTGSLVQEFHHFQPPQVNSRLVERMFEKGDILPNDTLIWRLKPLIFGAPYANPHVEAITVEVLILARPCRGSDIIAFKQNLRKSILGNLQRAHLQVDMYKSAEEIYGICYLDMRPCRGADIIAVKQNLRKSILGNLQRAHLQVDKYKSAEEIYGNMISATERTFNNHDSSNECNSHRTSLIVSINSFATKPIAGKFLSAEPIIKDKKGICLNEVYELYVLICIQNYSLYTKIERLFKKSFNLSSPRGYNFVGIL